MEDNKFFIEMKEMVEEYVEERLLLIRLQATEKAAHASSTGFLWATVGMLILIILLIVSFILGYVISQALNNYVAGFSILAAFYVILIYILITVHKKVTGKIIIDKVVKFSLENKKNTP